MKEHYKKGELTKQILMLCVVGGAVISVAVFPGLAYIVEAIGGRNRRQYDRVRQAVRQMERKGVLKRRIRGGKEEFVVMPKGKRQIASYLLLEMKIENQKKWDGKWRVLMFDIPEKKERGKIRRGVSSMLRDIGMKPIQHSVFISPFPCKKEIDHIARFYEVEEDFIYFETDNIECEKDLLKTFALKK